MQRPHTDFNALREMIDLMERESARNDRQDKRHDFQEKRLQSQDNSLRTCEQKLTALVEEVNSLRERVSSVESTVQPLLHNAARQTELEYMENPYSLDGEPRCNF